MKRESLSEAVKNYCQRPDIRWRVLKHGKMSVAWYLIKTTEPNIRRMADRHLSILKEACGSSASVEVERLTNKGRRVLQPSEMVRWRVKFIVNVEVGRG